MQNRSIPLEFPGEAWGKPKKISAQGKQALLSCRQDSEDANENTFLESEDSDLSSEEILPVEASTSH